MIETISSLQKLKIQDEEKQTTKLKKKTTSKRKTTLEAIRKRQQLRMSTRKEDNSNLHLNQNKDKKISNKMKTSKEEDLTYCWGDTSEVEIVDFGTEEHLGGDAQAGDFQKVLGVGVDVGVA